MRKDKEFTVELIIILFVAVSVLAALIIRSNVIVDIKKENKVTQSEQNGGGDQEIYVNPWYDEYELYGICSIESKGNHHTYQHEGITYITTDRTIDEIAKQNEDYVCDIKFYESGIEVNAKLFLHEGRGCYAMYNDYQSDCIVVCCCMATILNGVTQDVFFPSPAYTVFDYGLAEIELEYGKNIVDEMFESVSYEEACEFYKRLDSDIYLIDKENKTITVDGYHPKNNKYLDKYVTIDWKNKTYTYDDIITGEHTVFDGSLKEEKPVNQPVYGIDKKGQKLDYEICMARENDVVEYNYDRMEVSINSIKSGDKMPEYKKEDLIDKDNIYPYAEHMESAILLFHDNNYYGLFYNEKCLSYILTNFCGIVDVKNNNEEEMLDPMTDMKDAGKDDITFPMPGKLMISQMCIDINNEWRDGYNNVERFFDRIDFDYASEFYGRFTNDCADIDSDDQTITVDGYDRANDEYVENFMTIDWKNKTFTYTDPGSGEKVVYEG